MSGGDAFERNGAFGEFTEIDRVDGPAVADAGDAFEIPVGGREAQQQRQFRALDRIGQGVEVVEINMLSMEAGRRAAP